MPRFSCGIGSSGARRRVFGSSGSGPCSRLKRMAASSTDRVIGPGVSSVSASGSTPWTLMRPIVVLSPTMPHQEAADAPSPRYRCRSRKAQGAPQPQRPSRCSIRRARAAPRSPRNPRGPHMLVGTQPPIANSTVWVLPMTIIPAAMSFRARVAVVFGDSILPHLGAAGRDPPLDIDEVFDRDRNAVQRAISR